MIPRHFITDADSASAECGSTAASTPVSACYIDGCVPFMGVVYFESLDDQNRFPNFKEVRDMKWEKPSYNDLRFGFEVTMYIYNR